jgi:hypothetical protein
MKHTTTNKDNRSAVAANVRAELVAPITLAVIVWLIGVFSR